MRQAASLGVGMLDEDGDRRPVKFEFNLEWWSPISIAFAILISSFSHLDLGLGGLEGSSVLAIVFLGNFIKFLQFSEKHFQAVVHLSEIFINECS